MTNQLETNFHSALPQRNRGGRPSNEDVRRRRLAEILQRVADSDLYVAEAALKILEDVQASPATKIQAGQLLAGIKQRIEPTLTAPKKDVDEDEEISVDDFIRDLSRRARALEKHFGKPMIELLPTLPDGPLPHDPTENLRQDSTGRLSLYPGLDPRIA